MCIKKDFSDVKTGRVRKLLQFIFSPLSYIKIACLYNYIISLKLIPTLSCKCVVVNIKINKQNDILKQYTILSRRNSREILNESRIEFCLLTQSGFSTILFLFSYPNSTTSPSLTIYIFSPASLLFLALLTVPSLSNRLEPIISETDENKRKLILTTFFLNKWISITLYWNIINLVSLPTYMQKDIAKNI